jgi:hypothetical protein
MVVHEGTDGFEDIPVIGGDLGQTGPVRDILPGKADDAGDQLLDAQVPGGHHLHHGDAQGLFQGPDVDMDALVFGNVRHIDGYDHRRAQKEDLRQEVEAPFQGGGVGHKDDDVGVL